MSAPTMHSIDSGTTVRRHTRDDGHYGLLGTTVAGHVLGAVAVAGGYYATAQLGAALKFPSAPVSALWFPNALLLGALLLAPRRYWWVYLLAILPAHLLAQLPLPDVTVTRVLVQYVLNVGTALIAAFALTHEATEPLRFDRVRPAWRLVLFGGLVAPLTTSLLMAATFLTVDVDRAFWLTTCARTLTNSFAILTLVPLMLHGAAWLRAPHHRLNVRRVTEAGVADGLPHRHGRRRVVRATHHRGCVPPRWCVCRCRFCCGRPRGSGSRAAPPPCCCSAYSRSAVYSLVGARSSRRSTCATRCRW